MLFVNDGTIFYLNDCFHIDGHEVWSAFLPAFEKNSKINLIEQRSTAHFPLPPQTLLFGKCDQNWISESTCKTVMYAFNPVTGEGLSTPIAVHDFELLQISVLPFEGIFLSLSLFKMPFTHVYK